MFRNFLLLLLPGRMPIVSPYQNPPFPFKARNMKLGVAPLNNYNDNARRPWPLSGQLLFLTRFCPAALLNNLTIWLLLRVILLQQAQMSLSPSY